MGDEETKRSGDEQHHHHFSAQDKALVPLPQHQLQLGKKPNNHRDGGLAEVEMEKRLALIKAWEDNEKTKADNKASLEAQLKQIEEKIEKKKAEYAAKMKNKTAMIHRAAEEKRAVVEADRGKDLLMVEEAAAKHRATGNVPKKLFACFSC
ncbi:UNVERIFIED_CONTAM: hypothetical protein Sradi_6824000 [Sesamum radiatum]|uniref:Remorin C-terminal domain-containing protein n=1 Tax=Sesamum radiatum TaxID=300843 RepID=A0AAW2JT03_SESRA